MAQVIAQTCSFSWGRAGTKGADTDSRVWAGGRRKRKPVQGTRLCKVLKVSVKKSGAGQDVIRQCQVSGKAKERVIKVITNSFLNKTT